MKVILLEEVRGKGGEGDVVDVARGFANNYLLRMGKAVKATDGNLKQLEQRRKNIAKREEVRIANAEARKAQLEGTVITIKTKVGEEGQLFGSVTAQMVADGIKEAKDLEIDRRRVEIRQAIKVVGEHEVEISLYRDIKAIVKLNVVDEAAPEEEEAPEAEAAEAVEGAPEADAPEAEAAEAEAAEDEAAEAVEAPEAPVAAEAPKAPQAPAVPQAPKAAAE